MEEHPMKDCQFCKFEICWKSVPQKEFTVKDMKGEDRKVTQINLIRGRFEDVIGWTHDGGKKV
jgi:hypothetical protein